jgi:NADPH:quinone reductase
MKPSSTLNRQIQLASRPSGFPTVSDFQLAYKTLPSPGTDEVMVRSVYLSLDPWTRGRMDAGSGALSIALGDVIPGGVVGFVTESNDPDFRAGDAVEGMLGWQEYAVARGRDVRKLDLAIAPLSTALGVLGLPGLTAYFGLLAICDPRPHETVVISGAAGGVGMLAGQIAKIRGCRVVGVVGADAGISWLVAELGFDAAFHQTTAADLHATLGELCPSGVDIYFDNVGGAITDAVFGRINVRARIAIQSSVELLDTGPRWLGQLISRQAKVEGILVSAWADRFPEAREQLAAWLRAGRLRYREDVSQGIESAPQAFIAVLNGLNEGKQLVQLSEPHP